MHDWINQSIHLSNRSIDQSINQAIKQVPTNVPRKGMHTVSRNIGGKRSLQSNTQYIIQSINHSINPPMNQ